MFIRSRISQFFIIENSFVQSYCKIYSRDFTLAGQEMFKRKQTKNTRNIARKTESISCTRD